MASRTSRRLAIACAVAILSAGLAGGVVAATTSERRGGARTRARPSADRGIEHRVDALLRRMTLQEKLQQVQLLSDGQITDADAQAGVGGVFSLTDPADQPAAAHRRRPVAAGDPDPVRLRHDPRLPHDLPDPAGHRGGVRPGRRRDRPPDRRARVRRGRAQADLQPDGRRLARAALGPDLRGRRRGPVPELGAGGRARQGRPGQRLQPRRTRSSRASSTSPPTASPRAAATTTRPTCPRRGCGTSTCRRSRPRSTRAPTPRCARSTRSAASPAARTRRRRPTSSSASGASTASSSPTTPPSPSCAPARRRRRTRARAATASRPTARTRRRRRSTPAPTPRWSARTCATTAPS